VIESVWDRIESSRERWNVLNHPFYQQWNAGELTDEALAYYSGQYRHAAVAVATMSEQVANALPDNAGLKQHLAEEQDHVRVWDGFVNAVGGDTEAAANPETAACVAEWTKNESTLATLARLYAVESGQPEISKTKRAGLLNHYGQVDGPATEYFSIHAEMDVEHAAEARKLIEKLATDEDADEIVAAAESAMRANWRLLDGCC